MQVRMLSNVHGGASGLLVAGSTYDLPDALAQHLVGSGNAALSQARAGDNGPLSNAAAAAARLVLPNGRSRGGCRIAGGKNTTVADTSNRTNFQKIEMEAPFDAIRITICSRETASAANWKFVCAPTATAETSSAQRLFDPTPDGSNFLTTLAASGTPSGWRAGTFAGAATGTVPAGASLSPAYLQSDWIPCVSVPRSDVPGGRPLVMLRIYHNGTADGSHSITSGLQPAGGWADQTAKDYYRVCQQGNSIGFDYVADLTQKPGSGGGSGYWVYVEAAYRGVAAVRSVIGIGDSLMEANSTQLPGNVFGAYGLRGVARASTQQRPIHWINAGMSSETTATYFAAGLAAITVLDPTDVLYCPFGVNDGSPDRFLTDAMQPRLAQIVNACRTGRRNLLLVTSPPNNTYNLAQDTERKRANELVRVACAVGVATLVDYADALGDGASPERYLAGMFFDSVHPSDAAMDIGGNLVRDALLATW